jgi:hypothetical protein
MRDILQDSIYKDILESDYETITQRYLTIYKIEKLPEIIKEIMMGTFQLEESVQHNHQNPNTLLSILIRTFHNMAGEHLLEVWRIFQHIQAAFCQDNNITLSTIMNIQNELQAQAKLNKTPTQREFKAFTTALEDKSSSYQSNSKEKEKRLTIDQVHNLFIGMIAGRSLLFFTQIKYIGEFKQWRYFNEKLNHYEDCAEELIKQHINYWLRTLPNAPVATPSLIKHLLEQTSLERTILTIPNDWNLSNYIPFSNGCYCLKEHIFMAGSNIDNLHT